MQAASKSADTCLSIKMVQKTETNELPQTFFFAVQNGKKEAAA